MNVESVFPKVRDIVADVLVIEAEDVALDSKLIADLGAESIDFLDLVFQLEKAFQVKIPRGQLEKNARGDLSEEAFEQGGVITPEGIAALKAYLTEVPESSFTPSLKVNEIPMLFTVETFCKLIVTASESAVTADAAEA